MGSSHFLGTIAPQVMRLDRFGFIMANEAQLKSILKDVDAWNQWRKECPHIIVNLRKANFSKAELPHINLSQAGLYQAKLRKANLVKANLSFADLSNANLNQANLNQANLRRINLAKADLVVADLQNVDLRRGDIRRANLTKANLSQGRLNGANLRGANLQHTNLVGAKLVGVNLTAADLTDADLTDADLTGANLMGSNLTRTTLKNTNLINCQLSGITWTQTNLDGAKFKNHVGLNEITQNALKKRGGIFMAEPSQFYHLLVIKDKQGTRSISLDAHTYVIGRDANAGIRIYDPSVSRQHALLMRLFDDSHRSFYHLVDGDIDGNRSKNGIKVNQSRCHSQLLETGDEIKFGKTTIQYQMKELTLAELKRKVSPIPN